MLKNISKNLPDSAGVYTFFKGKTPIYIGKAINLKRRVSSYFDLDLNFKTAKMVSGATNLKFIQVSSEIEALLLEAKLVRKFMPHYNIQLKDDKHPLYIVITKEKFPCVLSVRKLIANNYPLIASFGPFPNSQNVHSVLKMIRRIFPYSDHVAGSGKIGKRACLYSHIGLCNPCPNISTDNKLYLHNIKNIKQILDGKINKLKLDMIHEMQNLSSKQQYEEALEIRNKIEKLEYITKPQTKIDSYLENPNLYEDQRKLEINALSKLVNLKNLHRIECFDIAHLSGTYSTASMVTFIDGESEKSEYRHFRIKQNNSRSDYDSMEEVAKRRIKHFDDWGVPDLIIVDGSIGQINKFKENIKIIPIVGIAKNPDRLILNSKNKLKLQGSTLQLVSRIRDEAHRFARRYHHSLILNSIRNENNS